MFFFAFFLSLLCDFWHRSIPNWRSPIWIGDLPDRLATCPLVPLPSPFPSLPLPSLPSPPFPFLPLLSPPFPPFPTLLLPSPPFPSLPHPSPPFPSLPLPFPSPLPPHPPSLPIPFLLSLPSLPSSYPSPSPAPRPQVSRLRALVFLTSSPLARELCIAHVLCKRRGPWSEPDLSLPDQLHASSTQRMCCHSHNVTAQCTEVPLLWVGMTCCKFHLLSYILLNSCWYCSFPFKMSCFPSLLCRLYYPVQADLFFRFVLHAACSLCQAAFLAMFFHTLCVSSSNLPLFFPIVLHLSPVPLSRLSSFATVSSLTLFNAFVLQLLVSPFWNVHFFNSMFFDIVMFAFLKLAFFICMFFAFVLFAFLWVAFISLIFLHCFCTFFKLNIF